MFERHSFAHVLGAVLVLSFVVGFGSIRSMDGAITNKGTSGAIKAENALIMKAESTSCGRFGTYASIATLRRRRTPHVPAALQTRCGSAAEGQDCGTIVSSAPRVSVTGWVSDSIDLAAAKPLTNRVALDDVARRAYDQEDRPEALTS